jgi:IPT/TIG domain
MAEQDYTPVLVPGDLMTVRTAGRFHAGDPLEVAGPGEVRRAAAGSLAYVGIAAEDCATGVQTVVMVGGTVQESVADGEIFAGDLLSASATPGRVTPVSGPGIPAGPSVTAIAPVTGPTAGGTPVTVTGGNFDLTAVVEIGTGTATSVVITADDTLTCVTPAGVAGLADVTVTTAGGTATLGAAFTYTAPAVPAVGGVAPPAGTTAGGTGVTVTGTNLLAATGVTFGGAAATDVVVVDATTITCTTPAGAAGAVRVEVTTPGGTGGLDNAFTYTAAIPVPVPADITPVSGSTAGGDQVTITGTGLTGATPVTFRGVAATNVTVVSDTEITCTTPAGAAGNAPVLVTTPGGIGTVPGGFTYTAPPAATLTGCAPASGPAGQTTPVTLTGTGLTGTTSVTFGVFAAAGITVDSPTQIRCTAPAQAAGSVTVVAVNPNGNGTLPAGFTYVAAPSPPTVTDVNPAQGPAGGGMGVAVTGTGFTGTAPATGVTFGGTPATLVTVDDDTSIHCATPAGTPGAAVDVAVTTPAGTGTLPGGFTYQPPANPTAVTPDSGPDAGGASVTITGTGFTGSGNVLFGTGLATNRVIVNDTTITCDTPAHAAGTVNVTVAKTGGNGVLPNGYTFLVPPSLTEVDPDTGSAQGDEPVSLIGTGFTDPIAVRFGTADSAQTAVISPILAACTTPAGTQGDTVDVTVTCAGGSDTRQGGFTYVTPLAEEQARTAQAEEPKPAAKKSKAKQTRTAQPEEQQQARIPARGGGEDQPAAYMPRGPIIGLALTNAADGEPVRWLRRLRPGVSGLRAPPEPGGHDSGGRHSRGSAPPEPGGLRICGG